MKTISSLRDLEPFGIVALTGEADNLGFRLLCDMTKAGRVTVSQYLGLNLSTEETFPGNWNHGDPKDPHVASFMLDTDGWLGLAVFALMTAGKCHTVIKTERGVFGLEMGELFIHADCRYDNNLHTVVTVDGPKIKTPDYTMPLPWPVNSYGEITRVYRSNITHPHDGSGRNVHAMSGRTV